jgi:hypothetical protein
MLRRIVRPLALLASIAAASHAQTPAPTPQPVDTYDHVRPADLVQGVTAWELANMPERLPHQVPAVIP